MSEQQPTDNVDEITALRFLVSRLRRRLRDLSPHIATPAGQEIIREALSDHGGLGYEIH